MLINVKFSIDQGIALPPQTDEEGYVLSDGQGEWLSRRLYSNRDVFLSSECLVPERLN